jgi:hypothetical protein
LWLKIPKGAYLIMIIYIIIGIIAGIIFAWLLNKLFANKIEKAIPRISMKAIAYIFFIIIGVSLAMVNSVKPGLDKFLNNQVNNIETTINRHFPDQNMWDIHLNTIEFLGVASDLQQITNNLITKQEGFFKKKVLISFVNSISPYLNVAFDEDDNIQSLDGIDINTSLKTVLSNAKDIALDNISPYITLFNILILILFVIITAAYISIAVVLKK